MEHVVLDVRISECKGYGLVFLGGAQIERFDCKGNP